MTFTLRQATKTDLDILEHFQQESANHVKPFDPTIKQEGKIEYYNIPELIDSKNINLIIVENEDNKVVACGYGEIKDSPKFMKETKFGYIGFMFVLEEFRSQGIGKLILDEIFKWFKENNIKEITLKVYSENINAIKRYEKYGFKHLVTTMHAQIK
jgi:ribosomal protein S18 acetylase RimI-like enzyme